MTPCFGWVNTVAVIVNWVFYLMCHLLANQIAFVNLHPSKTSETKQVEPVEHDHRTQNTASLLKRSEEKTGQQDLCGGEGEAKR